MLIFILKTFILMLIISVQFFYSCATTYKAGYFVDVPNSANTIVTTVTPNNVPKIKYDNVLSTSVIPHDQLSALYQTAVSGTVISSPQTTQLSPPASGSRHMIDKNGIIRTPLAGILKLSGLTIDKAKEVLHKKYAIFFKDFTINLDFLNHKIIVLGEVGHPGSFNLQADRI